MRKNFLTLALISLLANSTTSAAEPTEKSNLAPKKRGDICRGISTFDCNLIGTGMTVKDIYQRGWRVVAAYYIPNTGLQNLIVEEQ